jgi:hypothetical protein
MDDRLLSAASRLSGRPVPQAPTDSPIFRSSSPQTERPEAHVATAHRRRWAPRSPIGHRYVRLTWSALQLLLFSA